MLVGKENIPEEKRLFERPRRRWKDNVKRLLKTFGVKALSVQAEDSVPWPALMNAEKNLGSKKGGKFLEC